MNGRNERAHIIARLCAVYRLNAKSSKFLFNDRRELILDKPFLYFGSRGDKSRGLYAEWCYPHERSAVRNVGGGFRGLHDRRINHQRNNAGTGKRGTLLYRSMTATSGNHYLVNRINGIKTLRIKLKNTVNRCGNGEFSFMGLFGYHAILAMAKRRHTVCRIVFVKLIPPQLPHKQMLFAHAEQHGNIGFFHYVALLKAHALKARFVVSALAGNDLGHVVAQHVPDRIFRSNLPHAGAPLCLKHE